MRDVSTFVASDLSVFVGESFFPVYGLICCSSSRLREKIDVEIHHVVITGQLLKLLHSSFYQLQLLSAVCINSITFQ